MEFAGPTSRVEKQEKLCLALHDEIGFRKPDHE